MTPFIITKNGDIDTFEGGKMDSVYHVDDQYFGFFEKEARELQAEKSKAL